MNQVRKTFASVGIAALALTAIPAGAVDGQSIEDLQAQIQQLMNQIAQLQGGTTGPAISGVPAGYSFGANMGQGSTGESVRYLQIVLNSDSATQVASIGVGSAGNETTFYGPLTAQAVSRFQQKYASEILAPLGLTSGTGFTGASTRAKLNSLLAAAPAPADPTDPAEPSDPEGPAVEGTLSASLLAVPSAVELGKGQSKSVIGVELEATDSNIRLQRADVTLEKTGNGDADERPWRSFDRIQLMIDGDVVASRSITSSSDFTESEGTYTVRLSGFTSSVAADSEEEMEVALRVRADISDGNLGDTWTVSFANQAIRGLDGMNINQFTGGPSRTFQVVDDAASLSVEFNDNSPEERVVQVSTNSTTQNVTLLTFDLENTSDIDVVVEDLPVEITVSDSANDRVDDVVSVVQLRRGSTTLGSENVTADALTGTANFQDINLTVPADSTVTLEVRATLKARTDGNYAEGESVSANVDGENINAIFGDEEGFDVDGEVNGENQYLFSRAPVVSFQSASLTPGTTDATEHIGSAVITFTVQAQGGTIFMNLDDALTTVGASAGQVTATSTVWSVTGSATSVTGTDDWADDDLQRISSGSTATFEVAFLLENDDTGPINVRGLVDALTWGTAADGTGEQTWDDDNLFNLIENLRTPLRLLAEGPA